MLSTFLLAAFLNLVLFAAAAAGNAEASARPGTGSACSDASDLRRRISLSLSPTTGLPTPHLKSLRGVVEDVLSEEECRTLEEWLSPDQFVRGGGYDDDKGKFKAGRSASYSGLGLKELSSRSSSILTEDRYEAILEMREKARKATERALGLCPGTLRVDFTTVSQKTAGGTHRPHADNAFHKFEAALDGSDGVIVRPDPSRGIHPYPHRIAASILYLNDGRGGGYGGGEFYFADHASGEPYRTVEPRTGRMVAFTAGVENLHGALPVTEVAPEQRNGNDEASCGEEGGEECRPARRLALAMWYTCDEEYEEIVPEYGALESSKKKEGKSGGTKIFELPVRTLKRGGLKLALSLHLLGRQNSPSQGSWKFVSNDDEGVELGMLFQDNSAMVTVSLRDDSITVERHTAGGNARPSLRFMLQESVLLHDLLDELHSLAFQSADGDEIRDDDRLVRFQEERDGKVIEDARGKLPARRA